MKKIISITMFSILAIFVLSMVLASCGGGGGSTPSSPKAMTAFSFPAFSSTGTIDEDAKTISITVPFGTSRSGLIATFVTTGASVRVGATTQVSGVSPNDFVTPVSYVVTASDGTTATYTVTVTVALNSAKSITAFSLAVPPATGTIDEGAKTISLAVPFGTSPNGLVATFATTGASVSVGTTTQVSGVTPNDFTAPVLYIVRAANGTTATYAVTVTASLCDGSASAAQLFSPTMSGCAGVVSYPNRASLCSGGSHVCNAYEWVQNRGSVPPAHHYWTDDNLNYSLPIGGPCGLYASCGTGNCFVTLGTKYTNSCPVSNPMHVCSADATDPEGNMCGWRGCGLNSVSPAQNFGGCSPTAGALCCSGTQWYFVKSAGGSDSNAGTNALPFKTITKALSVAVAGDTVYVKPGTYDVANGETFPLSIPAGVNLLGDEPNRGAGATPTLISGKVIVLSGSTLAGFTVTNPEALGAGVACGTPMMVSNNTITGNDRCGIDINYSSGAQLILLNTITNNDCGVNAINTDLKIENNTITGNYFGLTGFSGDLGGGAAGSIGHNVISCNMLADLWAGLSFTVNAQNNIWDHSPPSYLTSGLNEVDTGTDVYNHGGIATIITSGYTTTSSPCP